MIRVYYNENRNKKMKPFKTENMKTTVKQLAAGTLVALLLAVGNVNAEGTETSALSRETETTLQVEKWMTDEALWSTNVVSISEINQQTEATLELESWMTSTKTWNFSNSLVEETEEYMEVECWMTCDKIWNKTVNIEETEKELTVENWMISEDFWNE
jgi:hypothetical protein